jgi:YVTN family beta-propeller protein
VPVGAFPAQIAADPLTDTVYAASGADGGVTVIDGRTATVRAKVTTGQIPFGVAVDPLTGTVYVSNQLDNTVSVVMRAGR